MSETHVKVYFLYDIGIIPVATSYMVYLVRSHRKDKTLVPGSHIDIVMDGQPSAAPYLYVVDFKCRFDVMSIRRWFKLNQLLKLT